MCCLRAVTSVFVHLYFRNWKHVSEKFSRVIFISQREVVFTQKTRKKHFNFHYFWSKFVVAKLSPKSLNFLSCCAVSTYTLCFEMSLHLLISFSPPCTTLKSLPHTVHKAKPSLFVDFWMNLNLLHQESLNFTKYFFFFECFVFFHGNDFTW